MLHHAALGEVHGKWMVKELAHHGYHIGPGSLHRASHKMEAEGLIRSHSEVAVGQVHPRHVATAKGRRTLRSSKRRLRGLAEEVMGDETW
jgi:PadR family transcriptional regulator PadR